MTPDQKGVARGMATGVAITLATMLFPLYWGGSPTIADDMSTRVAVWLLLAVSVAFWIVVGVARLARQRFFNAQDINAAAAGTATNQAKMLQAVLQNSLEQSVLAIAVYGAWLFWAPAGWRTSAIVAALLFLVGRLLFTLGYAHGAQTRSLGFALTFYPSVLLMIMVFGRAAFVFLAG